MENSIKKLRFNLETPIVSDQKVDEKFNIPSMHQGEQLPDAQFMDNSTIAYMVRFMVHNHESFLIDSNKADVLFDYFVDGMLPVDIAEKRAVTTKQANQIVLRHKKKAVKLLKDINKKSDLLRLSKNYTFIAETCVS